MKNILPVLVLSFIAHMGLTQSASFEWAMQCGNPPNTSDTKTNLCTGEDGAFYLAGEFTDTAHFGDETLVSEGGTDISLVKHSSQGEVEWAIQIGAADYDYVQRILTTSDGIIVAGFFYGSTIIGNDSYTSYGSQDIFLAKFDEEGNFIWSERFGGLMADYIASADVDEDGNILAGGYFYGEMTLGDTSLNASASSDVYLSKFSPDGELIWALAAGGSSSDQLKAISCDPDGHTLATISFYYDFSIGDTTVSTTDPVGAGVIKVTPEGIPGMVFQLTGTYLTPDNFIRADHEGNFYLAGNFSDQIFFGNTVFNAGEFNQDLYIARFSADGAFLWADHATSFSSDQVTGIDIDPYNNLYLTGHYLDSIRFGQLVLPYRLCCGSREIFIINYSTDGKVNWGKQITGPRASVQSIAAGDEGKLLVSGIFTDTLAFDAIDLGYFAGYRTYVTRLESDVQTHIVPHESGQLSIRIFPVPSHDKLYLHISSENDYNYRILSTNGQTVLSGKVASTGIIDTSSLRTGLYFLQVEVEAGVFQVVKFIKH